VEDNVTHDMTKEPRVTSSDEEHSELPILEESYDSKRVDCALSFRCRDHEPFLPESTLEAQEMVEHTFLGDQPMRDHMHPWIGWTGT
jgi:hypothetical protein